MGIWDHQPLKGVNDTINNGISAVADALGVPGRAHFVPIEDESARDDETREATRGDEQGRDDS